MIILFVRCRLVSTYIVAVVSGILFARFLTVECITTKSGFQFMTSFFLLTMSKLELFVTANERGKYV